MTNEQADSQDFFTYSNVVLSMKYMQSNTGNILLQLAEQPPLIAPE